MASSSEPPLVALSRIALAGDAAAAHRFLGRLLRRGELGSAGTAAGAADDSLREALAGLLLTHTAAQRASREAQRRAATADQGPAPPYRAPVAPGGAPVENPAAFTRVEVPSQYAAPILPPSTRRVLDGVIAERLEAAELLRRGVPPTRSVLLVGPPGVGKTMSARYFAAVLGLPLVTVDLTSVMSSFLGQTGQNLRRALDGARRAPCVLLIDEIDALAKRRGDAADVGELKRVVNVLLLELDEWPETSLLVAATNHPELLDRALWRRFDRVVPMPRPGRTTRGRILRAALSEYGGTAREDVVLLCALATRGASGARLHALVRDARRDAVLGALRDQRAPGASADAPADAPTGADAGTDVSEFLERRCLAYLESSSRTDDHARVAFCGLAVTHLGLPQREVARRLGVSHVTVGRMVKAWHALPAGRRGTSGAAAQPPSRHGIGPAGIRRALARPSTEVNRG